MSPRTRCQDTTLRLLTSPIESNFHIQNNGGSIFSSITISWPYSALCPPIRRFHFPGNGRSVSASAGYLKMRLIAVLLVLIFATQFSVVVCKYVEGHLKTHDVSSTSGSSSSTPAKYSKTPSSSAGLGICRKILFPLWPRSIRVPHRIRKATGGAPVATLL